MRRRVTTTIAYDGTSIVSDGLACFADEFHRDNVKKIIVRKADGERPARIFALTGPRGMTDALIKWYEEGADPKNVPPGPTDGSGWSLAIIGEAGAWHIGSNCPYPTRVYPPFAWGSGAAYARALMEDGRNAKRAVEIACKLDRYSGGKLQEENVAKALGLAPPPEEQTYIQHPTKPDKMLVRQPKRERAA